VFATQQKKNANLHIVLAALLAALAMTLLNAFEPPTVDDVAHYYYARHFAEDPLHPYEFEIEWHQRPIEAWNVMVPPVYAYCWAPAIAWFPDSVVAQRFCLLPVTWLFCASLLALLRRYTGRHATALMWLFALGPAVLPGLNNMLEVPMLAVGLAALLVFHRAVERSSLGAAIGSGVLLGLAFQTKYSAFAFLGPFVLLGVLRRRPRELALSLLLAAVVALGIEGLLSLSHGGGSYFLNRLSQATPRDWPHVLIGMFLQVGVLGMPTTLLALRALRSPRWLIGAAAGLYLTGHVVIMAFPPTASSSRLFAPDALAYLVMSLCTWVTTFALFGRLLLPELGRLRLPPASGHRPTRWLLCAWFCSEIAASLVISPFPAARRVLTILLAMAFAAGWLLAHRRDSGRFVRNVTILSVLLGIGYQAVDFVEGRAAEQAAEQAVAYARSTAPKAKVYFTGGWAFEFCAPRAGLKPFLKGRTALDEGDLVVVGSIDGIEVPWFAEDPRLVQVHEIDITDHVPASLLFHHYCGRRPFDGQRGPRYIARILRATTALPVGSLHSIEDEGPQPMRRESH
jgi:4-amino-4-deoxy-L-arabinose transferase-like glycosyltransferase